LCRASSAIAPALLYLLHPCSRARRPSGHAAHVQNRIVQGCTGVAQHMDVRKRPPGDFVNHVLVPSSHSISKYHFLAAQLCGRLKKVFCPSRHIGYRQYRRHGLHITSFGRNRILCLLNQRNHRVHRPAVSAGCQQ